MGRMTRAKAAEVAEKLHIDEDAVLELPGEHGVVDVKSQSPESEERTVLGEIANNSGGSRADDDSETAELKRSTRGRKAGRKGGKGKKGVLAASTASTASLLEEGEGVEVVADGREAGLSPASEVDADGLGEGVLQGELFMRECRGCA